MTHFSDGVRVGPFFPAGLEPGVATSPVYVYSITPAALSANGVATAQAVSGAGNLTLNGALVNSAGVAVMDFPRAVSIVSTNAGDTTQTATVTGISAYGAPMTEVITFNGTTTVNGKKAFAKVTRVAISAALAGNAAVGTSDVMGLPYRAISRNLVLTAQNGAFVTTGTFVAADTTSPATSTTGDTRGTFVPPAANDGSRLLTFVMFPDVTSLTTAYGVTQA